MSFEQNIPVGDKGMDFTKVGPVIVIPYRFNQTPLAFVIRCNLVSVIAVQDKINLRKCILFFNTFSTIHDIFVN